MFRYKNNTSGIIWSEIPEDKRAALKKIFTRDEFDLTYPGDRLEVKEKASEKTLQGLIKELPDLVLEHFNHPNNIKHFNKVKKLIHPQHVEQYYLLFRGMLQKRLPYYLTQVDNQSVLKAFYEKSYLLIFKKYKAANLFYGSVPTRLIELKKETEQLKEGFFPFSEEVFVDSKPSYGRLWGRTQSSRDIELPSPQRSLVKRRNS